MLNDVRGREAIGRVYLWAPTLVCVVPGPVLDLPTLEARLAYARERGARIVLTNGVFDLLHVGHLRYLRQARSEGNLLVVGVNADRAVHKAGRPLVPEAERAELVAALEPVDYVVIFAEPTADALLRTVAPHVYAKGADYTPKTLPEARAARQIGARIVFIPLVAGHSTSALLKSAQQSVDMPRQLE
jgi:D-glycero-beta-D-manno-heptose 1-phosphate adenylyltransferase